MKRIRAHVDITRRTSVEFDVDDDLDEEEIKHLAIEEAELAEWEDDLPEVVSFEVLEEPWPPKKATLLAEQKRKIENLETRMKRLEDALTV
jgi:hypothetical protein